MRLAKGQEKAALDANCTAGSKQSAKPGTDWDGQADLTAWRLPSGKALAEFALEAGFLVPGLLRASREDRAEDAEAQAPRRKET